MKLTFDTNILVRFFTADDDRQFARVLMLIADAQVIAVSIAALCETAWVLRAAYLISTNDIADKLESFVRDERVRYDADLTPIGIAFLRRGGDFADAVIAADGQRLGGESFATFDKRAAKLLETQDFPVTLLQ